jgi:hypothetical protein
MPATKIDFKRELREFYAPGEPELVDVPELPFAMIDGHGDPNVAPEYRDAVQALYAVAYVARFALKRAPDGLDYGVMPLEGLWWVPDMSAFTIEDKSAWHWTAMIMQPEQVSAEVFQAARAAAANKKPSLEALRRVRLERVTEGPAAQVLYRGPTRTKARRSAGCTHSSPNGAMSLPASITRSTSAIPAAPHPRS